MATQLEVFRIVAPELADIDDATIEQFLSLAPLHMNAGRVPEDIRGLALVYKAASLITDRKNASSNQASGTFLASEREGDLQKDYREISGKSSSASISFRNTYEQRLAELVPLGGGIITRYGVA